MPENGSDTKRIEALEHGLNIVNLSLETIKISQGFLKEQQSAMMAKLELISVSLTDPSHSALGRALTTQINGVSARFDSLITSQQKELEDLRTTVHLLNTQNERILGALALIKFIGFSALSSGVVALLLILLQLLKIIVVKE